MLEPGSIRMSVPLAMSSPESIWASKAPSAPTTRTLRAHVHVLHEQLDGLRRDPLVAQLDRLVLRGQELVRRLLQVVDRGARGDPGRGLAGGDVALPEISSQSARMRSCWSR
jgi:hypothetical protein